MNRTPASLAPNAILYPPSVRLARKKNGCRKLSSTEKAARRQRREQEDLAIKADLDNFNKMKLKAAEDMAKKYSRKLSWAQNMLGYGLASVENECVPTAHNAFQHAHSVHLVLGVLNRYA